MKIKFTPKKKGVIKIAPKESPKKNIIKKNVKITPNCRTSNPRRTA